ncbi:hypothetical protein ACFQV4_17900 [Streptomyces thermocarboxydus]
MPSLADPGTRWAVKNGWLPRDATGLWVVNSTGCVTVGGRVYAVAVLSDGHASMTEGWPGWSTRRGGGAARFQGPRRKHPQGRGELRDQPPTSPHPALAGCRCAHPCRPKRCTVSGP